MNTEDRLAALEETIDELIDRYTIVKSQNLAMNHALAGLFSILPDDLREQAAKHYDFRCATFQTIVNNGKTDLDALAIQRKEFASTRERIFRKITS